MRALLLTLSIAVLAGCSRKTVEEPPLRNVTLDVQTDDPSGVYIVRIKQEEVAHIEDDLVIDVLGSTLDLDKAWLRNAVVNFRHKGQPIPNAHPQIPSDEGIFCWLLRRDATHWHFFIGTFEDYTQVADMY